MDAGRCSYEAGPAMVDLGAFCIDSTEVSVAQYDVFLAAVAGDAGPKPLGCPAGASLGMPSLNVVDDPATGMDWCSAYAYCRWAGKRLCGRIGGGRLDLGLATQRTLSEWYQACAGLGSDEYPYGATYMPGACNDKQLDAGGAVRVGSLPLCQRAGVFDLAGNAEEWSDICEDTDGSTTPKCAIMGDSYIDDQSKCGYGFTTGVDTSSSNIGFRCCATP